MRLPFARRPVLSDVRVEPEIKAAAPVEMKSDAADAASVLATLSSLTTPATLANPDPGLYELFGIESSLTGENFAAEMAMKCTPSRAAILAISETLGTLPVHTFALAADGSRSRDRAHPADTLLNVAACPWMPGSEFRELLTRDALLYGRGTAFINRASDGRVLSLDRIIPGTLSVNVDTMTGEPAYHYSCGSGRPTYLIRCGEAARVGGIDRDDA